MNSETDIQGLRQALHELPNLTKGPTAAQVRQLGELIDSELPLQSFLEQLLPEVTALFGGVAAVAWMKAQGAPGAVFGVRYRMEGVVSSVTEHKKHDRLVQIAWQQRQPMLAEPTRRNTESESGEEDENSESNPTDHALVFGPVLHAGDCIALLEVVLDKSDEALTKPEKQLFLRAIQLVAERVYGGLRQRMSMPEPTLGQAVEQMTQLRNEIESIQQQIVRTIEGRLLQFHGWSFGTLQENQSLAKMIHQLLDSHGLRVQCPECKNPAILRCLRAGNSKTGAFVFDHYLESGRTFHGGPNSVPLLKVVAKPARRASANNTAATG